MNPRISMKVLSSGFALLAILIQSACSTPTAPIQPSNTSAPNTSPPDTFTPQATVTFTSTPTITPTTTPNVTATQLPEITPPTEGKGNVIGLVLWNNQPVPKAAVWLCEKFEGGCVGTYQYRTNADENGYYVFHDVIPGKYLVAINSFSTGWFIFYFDSNDNREQQVTAGTDLILDPWNIWKIDLKPIAPRDGKDISDTHPTFSWEPYPDAAYYQFSIYDQNFNTVLENKKVAESEFILTDATLVTCNYYWTVEAINAEGVVISQLKAPNSTFMYLINHSVPGTC